MSGSETPRGPMPDDGDLDAFLAGSGPERAAWQKASGASGPPPALDAAILAVAQAAVVPAARARPLLRRRRVQWPLALAATVVLGMSLVFNLREAPELRGHEIAAAPAAGKAVVIAEQQAAAAAPSTPMAAPALPRQEADAAKSVDELRRAQPAAAKATPAPARAPRAAEPVLNSAEPAEMKASAPPPTAAPAAEPPPAFDMAQDDAIPAGAGMHAEARASSTAALPTADGEAAMARQQQATAKRADARARSAMAAESMAAAPSPMPASPAAAPKAEGTVAGPAESEAPSPSQLLRAAMADEAAGAGVERAPVLVCPSRNFKVLSSTPEEVRFDLHYFCVGEMDAAGLRFTPHLGRTQRPLTARLELGRWRLQANLGAQHLSPEGAQALLARLQAEGRLSAQAAAARAAEIRAAAARYLP